MKTLSPPEYITRAVNQYPSLYASPTYEDAKFKVLDHLLNTIGNGVFMKDFISDPVSEEEIASVQKWFSCNQAAYGYTRTKTLGSGFVVGEGNPVVTVTIDEMHLYPEIIHWVKFDCHANKPPYPNFQKEYSLVWDIHDIDFFLLGKEWAQAAIWYYERCRKFFLDADRVKSYHYAFPRETEKQTKETIKSYQSNMTLERYPTNEDISIAYECEFIGDRNNDDDVAAFIARRWATSHAEILSFIDETIERCESLIAMTNNV